MIYECAKLADLMIDEQEKAKKAAADGDAAGAKKHADQAHVLDERLGFLTPILKGFLTEAGKEAADLGIQIYGGHGYIKDNHAELNYRDVRIAPVWEGTTQIQVHTYIFTYTFTYILGLSLLSHMLHSDMFHPPPPHYC
jgi:alkylation response protein AidB-like acyl-CoA dehydrogenase